MQSDQNNEKHFLNLQNKQFLENRTKIPFFAFPGRYEQILNDVVIMANSDLHSRSKWGEAYDHLVMDHIE